MMATSDSKVDFSSPFVTAVFSVFSAVLGDFPQRGEQIRDGEVANLRDVNVLIGVVGDAEGHVILSMNEPTACSLGSLMVGAEATECDPMTASAIAELTNMICGTALMKLSDQGLNCDVAPPTVIRGFPLQIIEFGAKGEILPFQISQGEFSLTVSLQRAAVRSAVA